MLVHELLTPSSIICNLEGGSKKRTLEKISQLIAQANPDMSDAAIFNGLHGREKLGSTGIGDGIAIPHCRLAECKTAIGFLVKLETAVDFDAIDRQPVDLLFALIVPEDATSEHLQTLAAIAELFSQADVRQQLRQTDSDQTLYSKICELSS